MGKYNLKRKRKTPANLAYLSNKDRRQRKQFYYLINMKPEYDVHHRQSTKDAAQIERNLPLPYSQVDTTC